jgi:phenylalanyl-tRNA synthetase beta chain
VGEEDKLEHFKNVMREIFIGYGYQEVQTPILISQDLASLSQNIFVKIKNAVSENFSCVRSSLIPSLIDFLKENTRATYPQKIFECGDVVVLNKKLPEKTETLGFLSGAYIGIDANFSNIKGEIIGALESLGIKDLEFKSKKHILFLKGRCASIRYRGEEIGFFGEIHPKILSDFELFLPTAVFEINLNAIF